MDEIKSLKDIRDLMTKLNTERMKDEVLPDGIEAHYDIVFDGRSQKPYGLLDVYRPENAQGKLPVIIDIHGGGFCASEKDINENFCRHLALMGFVVVNISYDLLPSVTVDYQLEQCIKAFAWTKDHIGEYGGDVNNIFITGDSAGGYLCFYSTAIACSPELQKLMDIPDPGIDIRAIGISCGKFHNSGSYGSDALTEEVMFGGDYKQKKFLEYIGSPVKTMQNVNMPPLWFMTTELDLIRDMNELFAKELNEAGVPHEYVYIEQPEEGNRLGHVFNVTHPQWKESNEVNHKMTQFFGKHICKN